jgi:hypothetical protein
MERKQSNNHSTYAIVRTHKSHNRSFPCRVTFRWIWRMGKIYLHLTDSEGGKNPWRRHLYWAEIQRNAEEKRNKKHPSDPVLHISASEPILHQPSIPVAGISQRRSLSEFVRAGELPLMIRHRWELPLPTSIVAVNRIRHSHLIRRYLIRKLLKDGYTCQVQVR